MAYDEARQRTVLFGGLVGGDETWEWDGTNWTQLKPTVSPSSRMHHAMVYDSKRGRTVLFGGTAGGDETWEWDGKNWYPAYVDQHEKWHGGIGERGNDLDLVYGRELIMKVMPDGTIEPDIMYPLGKRHVSGSDKDLLMSTKEVAEKQSMRDWYLLAPKDMETVTMRGSRSAR